MSFEAGAKTGTAGAPGGCQPFKTTAEFFVFYSRTRNLSEGTHERFGAFQLFRLLEALLRFWHATLLLFDFLPPQGGHWVRCTSVAIQQTLNSRRGLGDSLLVVRDVKAKFHSQV